uniref:sodium channel protein type 4 subunit alpha B-like n=1 Tax=Semicossyphus pulcher TaxID=241346 RepID=UPI0037E91EBE
MSFFDFWRRRKERGDLLQRERRLSPSQLKKLLGDSEVQAALGDGRVVSLLPPVGQEVFRRFTVASLEDIQRRHEDDGEELDKRRNKQEAEKDLPKPASDLEAGKPLPFFYGDPPPELLNTPLEELDPFYQSQKTFLVLGKGNLIYRFNSGSAWFLLSPLNQLRTAAIRVLTHSFFSLVVMVTILTDCVFMMIKDRPDWSYSLDYMFTAVYTLEVVIKMVSRGVCLGRFTFLRDNWNLLDILVVILAYLSEFVDLGKVSVLAKVSRVLKLLPLIPGVKTTVRALVQSLRCLAGVMAMTGICLSLLALIGQQLFMGSLKQKCVMWPVNMTLEYTPDNYGRFDWNMYLNNKSNFYYRPHDLDALLCGNSSYAGACPEGFTCLKGGKNPNYGYTSYDSFGSSLLSLIRLMTHDFCDNLMQLTLRAAGKLNLTFFVLIVFPGCFCLLSLIVVRVAVVISKQEKAAVAEARQKEKEFNQIEEALKRSDKEPSACRNALSKTQDGEKEKSNETQHTELGVSEDDHRSCSPCWYVFANRCLKWNCCGCWQWLKQRLYALIMNPYFELIIVLCLIANVVFMAVEHYPMTEQFEKVLSISEQVFTFIFLAEMVLRLVAMDPYGYFQVGWNIFDSIIVGISLAVLMLDVTPRSLLLMRVFRLARWWPSFHLLLKFVWSSLRALRNLILVLLILVFAFTVAGMQLFQKDYKDCVCRIAADCELPRWHMNDFFHTFLIVFRVLIGEWIETLWDCMEVSGQAVCLIYFMMVVVIGNLLVLHLFLTLLLSSCSCDSLVATGGKENNSLHIAIEQIKKAFWSLLGKKKPDDSAADSEDCNRKEYLALDVVTSDQPVSEVQALRGNVSDHHDMESQKAPIAEIENELKTPENENEQVKRSNDVQKRSEAQQDEHDGDHKGNIPEDCCCHKCYQCCPFLALDKSQGTGRVWSNIRRACLSIVQHRVFETFMVLIILLSSAALVFEDIHLLQHRALKMATETADQVFTFVFLLEMLLKWSAFGLRRYFTNAWCLLDFLILDVSLMCLTADMFGFSELGAAVWSLRALMPLRTLSRFQGLRVLVQTLVRTLPSLINGVLVFMTVWLLFSILGVNLFAGKFFYCFNETSEEFFLSEQVNNKTECIFLINANFTEVRWKNLLLNYDNVAKGYLSLLHVVSGDRMDIMYSAVDSKELESQPSYEFNLYMYLYFIFFIISTFFILNFFIRVVVDTLLREKSGGKDIYATEDQLKYCKAVKNRLCRKPQKPIGRPQNQCQARLFDLVTSQWFEVFMVVVICLSVVVMMVETDKQSEQKDDILYWFSFTFFILFLIEFILKIIALRCHYFTSSWNILDFVVLVVYFLGMFIMDLVEKYFVSPALFNVLRLARIARITRVGHLLRWTRGTRKLLWAFMMSLPALFNICLLLLLITFSFSIFGMFNFAYVKKEYAIDDFYNFETFGNSLICLLMTSFSSGWYGLLGPIMKTPPDCDPYMENPGLMVTGNCGNTTLGIVFFTSYGILSFLLLVHLYIAVMLETFSLDDTLSDEDVHMFYKTWRKFDPDASQCIQYSELSDFCSALQDPLRIPKPNTIKLIHMNLPLLPGDKIHCVDVLLALTTEVLGESADMDDLKTRMEEKFEGNSSKVSCEPISSTLQRKQEEVAATVIQRAFKKCFRHHGEAEEAAGRSMGDDNGGSGV